MKPLFALTLLIGTILLLAGLRPTAAQELAAGNEAQPRSALFEALEVRATEESARQIAGTGDVTNPGMAWDRERAFAGMERLRSEIVTLSGLRRAQLELLQWNLERIKTGRAPALLQARLCREAALSAWCPLLPATFGGAAGPPPDRTPWRGRQVVSRLHAAERAPPNLSGNGPIKDELQ